MELVWILVVGGVIGWLASIVMGTNAQMGIVANVIIGIVGSWLGTFLAAKLGFAVAGTIAYWLVAVGGAALLILILKALKVFR